MAFDEDDVQVLDGDDDYDEAGDDEAGDDEDEAGDPLDSERSQLQSSRSTSTGDAAAAAAAEAAAAIAAATAAAALPVAPPALFTASGVPVKHPVAQATHATLLPSVFAHRPPTLYFERPPGLPPRGSPDSLGDWQPTGGPNPLRLPPRIQVPLGGSRVLCMRIEKNANSVRHAFKRAGFGVNLAKEPAAPVVTWSRHTGDKLWTQLPLGAVVNHFPGR